MLTLAATVLAFNYPQITENEISVYYFVFIVLIPVINAVFDWLSLGLTRYLLQKSLAKQRSLLRYAIFDFIAACLFLIALSLTIVAALAGLNAIAGNPPVDLAGILDKLRHTAGDPALWWIYIMIFSTFIPTFAHAGLALGSMAVTRVKREWREQVISGLNIVQGGEKSHDALVNASWYFASQRFLTGFLMLAGIAALAAVLYFFLPGFGRFILYLCEVLAQALGENVVPGKILPLIEFPWT